MVETDFIKKISLFASLGEGDLEKLKTLWKPVKRNAGQLLFKKGDRANSMYVVKDGEVAITVWTKDNQEAVLTKLGPGDFLGELALLDGAPRSASVKAMTESHLLEMTRDDFLVFLRSRPEVSITMMEVIAARLRATNEMMEHSTTRNVNEEIQHQMTFGDQLAARIAKISGSWSFIFSFICMLTIWIALNVFGFFHRPADPYPFNFLNFLLAFVTAIQAPIILMSQNRQYESDRLRSELEFQTNMKAEMQIQSLHTKLDELRASEIHDLFEIQREQREQLVKVHKHLEELRKSQTL
jgi:uncharacterized membrane protein